MHRVGAAAATARLHLLEQRPGECSAADQHLPTRLDVDARLDEELRALLDAGRWTDPS